MAKILVIEDTEDIRNMIVTTLKTRSHETFAAANGRDGIAAAVEHAPDVIICDIMMPYVNGYDVFKQLFDLEVVPASAFIFLTALDARGDIRRGMVMGADDYIVKPFAPADLLESIEAVLKRRELLAQAFQGSELASDIFISYSHQNSEIMTRVRESLVTDGFEVWTDERIESGRDWAEAVAEMIKNSSCVVAILTPEAAASTWVGRELGYAEANDTRIFPLLVGGDEREAVPLRLINHQFIDSRSDYDGALRRLVTAIRGHLKQLM